MTRLDMTFEHSYSCRLLTETPAVAPPHYYYPGASTAGGPDGLLLEVTSERGGLWIGTFAFGRITPRGVSGIFATPQPERLCVVAQGAGYIVRANDPQAWEAVPVIPIIDVRILPTRDLIVFASFIDLMAYGPAGMKWRTARLSWDGLKITEVTDTEIKGEFYDIRSEAISSFAVDVETGTHEGGIEEM
jgi:hypothetical protein